ncbi:MAG: peptidase S1, partial [Chloroflexi bacterium]
PYLEWFNGNSKVGNEVYVAGFPLGDPEYTLTRGIVSKENADGESNWASVDHVIEYDAQAAGGNSGGPVINANAQVVAVHYASSQQTDDQAFGISSDIAQGIVDQLMQGNDVYAIGINGRAIINDDGSIFGIWVSSVKSGSPADNAGIRPGDLLRQLEGLVLATDGTLADYCDILRGRSAEDTMSFSLWRLDTGEVLEGQLNGREAEVVGTLGDNTAADSGNTGASGSGSFMTVNDDSGQLAVNIPVEWAQVDGGAWVNDAGDNMGVRVVASPNIDGFINSWSMPGVSFRASDSLGLDDKQLIDQLDFSNDCQYGGREADADQLYSGQYDIWSNCGETGSTYVVLTAVPDDAAFVIHIEAQLVSDADSAAFDEILNSFIVQ